MGVCISQHSAKDVFTLTSLEIDSALRLDGHRLKTTARLLLLGAGSVGKTTVLKQIRILNCNGFTQDEYALQSHVIREVTLATLVSTLRAKIAKDEKDGFKQDQKDHYYMAILTEYESTAASEHGEIMSDSDARPTAETDAVTVAKGLWADDNFRKFCHEFGQQVDDSNHFFLDHMDRIFELHYIATQDDIIRLRIMTTGIAEFSFTYGRLRFSVVDVGGQRTQRRKWIHAFEGTDAIIFIAALSDYNLMMQEVENETACHSPWFISSSLILFLNKSDLFRQKLETIPLNQFFPDLTGKPQDYDEAFRYIKVRFLVMRRNDLQTVFVHETCATDTQLAGKIIGRTLDSIVARMSKTIGMY